MTEQAVDLAECSACPSLGKCCRLVGGVQLMPGRSSPILQVYSRLYCPHLDRDTMLCSRYETRLEVPWCRKGGDPEILWPTFCPHFQGKPIFDPDFLIKRYGLNPGQQVRLLDQIDANVREHYRKTYGVELT